MNLSDHAADAVAAHRQNEFITRLKAACCRFLTLIQRVSDRRGASRPALRTRIDIRPRPAEG